jgi:hypothetical protein
MAGTGPDGGLEAQRLMSLGWWMAHWGLTLETGLAVWLETHWEWCWGNHWGLHWTWRGTGGSLVSLSWWMAGTLWLEIGDRLCLLVGDPLGVVLGEPLGLALGLTGRGRVSLGWWMAHWG